MELLNWSYVENPQGTPLFLSSKETSFMIRNDRVESYEWHITLGMSKLIDITMELRKTPEKVNETKKNKQDGTKYSDNLFDGIV